MLRLLLELLESGDLPDLAVGGAWVCLTDLTARPAVARLAIESDIHGRIVAYLRTIGSPAELGVGLPVIVGRMPVGDITSY